jgi:hypothetical protein
VALGLPVTGRFRLEVVRTRLRLLLAWMIEHTAEAERQAVLVEQFRHVAFRACRCSVVTASR